MTYLIPSFSHFFILDKNSRSEDSVNKWFLHQLKKLVVPIFQILAKADLS